MNFSSKNSTGNFRKITAGIQIMKIIVFSLVRVCRQIFRSFSCIVDLIGGNSKKNFIRFMHSDLFFWSKPPSYFRLNVSIHTFVFVKMFSNDKLRLSFVHRSLFPTKKFKKCWEVPFFSKNAEPFFQNILRHQFVIQRFSLSKLT